MPSASARIRARTRRNPRTRASACVDRTLPLRCPFPEPTVTKGGYGVTGQGDEKGGAGPRAVHWFVSGRVQGVAFRYHTVRAAQQYGVLGDVRNLRDGRVEVRAVGGNLDAFLAEVRTGPIGARVDGIEEGDTRDFPTFERFDIRF